MSPRKSRNSATTLLAVETTTGIMIVAMVEACAAAETTVATVSTVVKVSGSSLSQVGPAQLEHSAGQPNNWFTKCRRKNLIYFRKY